MTRRLLASAMLLPAALACAGSFASVTTPPATASTGGAAAAIRESDLRRDMFAMASDSFRGREAGTLDELRAAAWVAERAREAGLAPAGDDGTYLQFWPMRRTRIAAGSTVSLDGAPLDLTRDATVTAPVNATLTMPLVWVGAASSDSLARLDLRGKAVAAMLLPAANAPVSWISLRPTRYAGVAVRERTAALTRAGAAAIVLVSDDSSEAGFDFTAASMRRGAYAADSAGAGRIPPRVPVIWTHASQRARVAGARTLTLALSAESFVYPSANVIAVVRGTDPALRNEYVLYSGHHDHDGMRFPIDGDSIWNGADDNASVSVGMLAIARAFAQRPARRSVLFVWHGAEERGLIGSRWFVAHPTVPLTSVVAVLNGDMIGRNAPDSAALLGAQPPHRNSTALVQAALDANARFTRFALDTLWDRPTHPEGWYFRSDHLPYARAGVPSIFFTTLLHSDYHTPRDEASRIDITKLARMSRWMYETGWAVANAAARPAVDAGFKLER